MRKKELGKRREFEMEKERARGRVSENRKKNPKGKEQRKENLNFLGVLGRA